MIWPPRSISTLLLLSALVCHFVPAIAVPYSYPIEASWFADRYTSQDWGYALDEFGSQGGRSASDVLALQRASKSVFCTVLYGSVAVRSARATTGTSFEILMYGLTLALSLIFLLLFLCNQALCCKFSHLRLLRG